MDTQGQGTVHPVLSSLDPGRNNRLFARGAVMDALRFCHQHHACKASIAWVREKNEAIGKPLTLLQGFDLCPFGRFKTWAWCRCARRHNIVNIFNLLHTELGLNQNETLNPDDPNDSLIWAMGEKCSVLWHMWQACYPSAAYEYCLIELNMTCAVSYGNICNAMQGRVSEIITDLGRPDVEAYDREYL
jgi:hypothetical protein